MTRALTCDELQKLAPELAAASATADERERAGHHLAGCPPCRAFVSSMTETIDLLLLLVPPEPPAVGFEVRILDRFGEVGHAEGRARRLLVAVAAAAAIVLAVVGIAIGRATAPDVPAHVVTSAELRAGDDRPVGRVYVHRGTTTWLVVDVEGLHEAVGPYGIGVPAETYRIELIPSSGPPVIVGELELRGGQGTAVLQPTVPESGLHAVRLVSATGAPGCEAVFD